MPKLLIRFSVALLLVGLLGLAWWGWSRAGLSLLQLSSFIC